jgi:cation transport regulator ChaC
VTAPLWIFGYGSLIWRPTFLFVERVPARLRGWTRRFWQGSTDHRGVPGAPGRVVTLVRDAEGSVDGVAFRIDELDRDEVLAHLDHREKGGYARHDVRLEALDGSAVFPAIVYVATEGNEDWLGPAPLDEIADTVSRARGPSGPNDEYVHRLAEALRELGAHDAHVTELDALLVARRAR